MPRLARVPRPVGRWPYHWRRGFAIFVDAFACSRLRWKRDPHNVVRPARLAKHALVFSSFFLFAQSVMAVTDSLSVPPYMATATSDLRPGGGHGTETR